jgi:alpha-mannosidase
MRKTKVHLILVFWVLPACVGAVQTDVYVVPFSHFDLFWAGTKQECLSRGNRIITRAVQLATQYPDFRFLVEDEVWVANYLESHSGLPEVEALKQLVRKGQIELAPKWAGIYQNLSRGEAHVRNQIYGKRYAREVFGVDPQVSHLGDLPGYTSQFPQILAKSGTPFVIMTRMGPPDCSLFNWRSPDGSTALLWNAIKGYGWGVSLGLHGPMDEKRLARVKKEVEDVRRTTAGPIYLGWGTDLWAPNEKLVENMELLNKSLTPLRFALATPDEYFRAVSKTSPAVPVFSGEIPHSWGNILSSMGHIWPPNIMATDALMTAETFAAINFALGYTDYPQSELESLWKRALEGMDHNNFGQGGFIADEGKMDHAREVILRSRRILNDMLRNIAARIKSPFERSTPITVFNATSWTRDDMIKTHVSVYGDVNPGDIGDYRKAMRLVDETGASIPFHVEQSYGTVSRAFEIMFVARGVPSLGYRTYFLVPADEPDTFPNACKIKPDNPDQNKAKRISGADQVENEFYRVGVDRVTGSVTVFDKELDRVVAKDIEIAASEERGGNSLALEPVTGRTLINMVSRVELEEDNPVRAVMRIDGNVGGVPIVQRVFLYGGIKRVDLESLVDWKDASLTKLEQLFPCEQQSARIRYGIPFGSAALDDIMPNTGPAKGDEISAEKWRTWRQIQDWIFMDYGDWGLHIAADRQSLTLGDDVIRVGMMRGTYCTQDLTREGKTVLARVPVPGTYAFRYSLCSGKGTWTTARLQRAGMAFSSPLVPVSNVDELSTKSLPPTRSFCLLDAENLIVTALKKAEADNDIVLRAFETDGREAGATVEFLGFKRRVRAVNLLEEQTGAVDQAVWRLKPYEIGTVRLSTQQ